MGVAWDAAEALNVVWGAVAGETAGSLRTRAENAAFRLAVARLVETELSGIVDVSRRPLRRLLGRPEFFTFLASREPQALPPHLERLFTDAFGGLDPAAMTRAADVIRDSIVKAASPSAGPMLTLIQSEIERLTEDQALQFDALSVGVHERFDTVDHGIEGLEALLLTLQETVTRRQEPDWPRGWNVPPTPVWRDDGGHAALLNERPPAAGSRESELDRTAELIAGPQGGCILVTGDVFRGKTTVMGELARRLETDGARNVLVLMNVRLADDPSTRPLEVLNSRLIQLIGAKFGLADDPARRPEQFRVLLDRAAELGHEVVVVIDALDEAPDREPLLAALSQRPPAGCWVVVSTRPNPPLPPSHQLARLFTDLPSQVIELQDVRQARERREAADAWIETVASTDDHFERQVFAAIVAAGAPLARHELADLLDMDLTDLNRVLEQERHRPWFTRPNDQGRTRLGHTYLSSCLAGKLGRAALLNADHKLRRWTDRYRTDGWPSSTPLFLLEHLPTRPDPRSLADSDADRDATDAPVALNLDERTELLLDRRWVYRRSLLPGQRRRLIAVAVTTLTGLNIEHGSGTDRFAEMFTLARWIAAWRAEAAIPKALIEAYATVGQADLAVDLARDAAFRGQYLPLMDLVASKETPERLRRALLQDVIIIAGSNASNDKLPRIVRGDFASGRQFLKAILRARDLEAFEQAYEIFGSLPHWGSTPLSLLRLMTQLAATLGSRGRLADAREIADNLLEPADRAVVLAAIGLTGDGEALSEASDIAWRLVNAQRPIGAKTPMVLAPLAGALTIGGRGDESRRLARRIEDRPLRAGALVAIGAAGDIAALGDACEMARELEPEDEAAILVASAEAGYERALDQAYELAQRLIAAEQDTVMNSTSPEMLAAADIGTALARDGRTDDAEHIASQIKLPGKAWVILGIAETLVKSGSYDDAQRAVDQLQDPIWRARGLLALAEIHPEALSDARHIAQHMTVDTLIDAKGRLDLLIAIGKAGDPDALKLAQEMLRSRGPAIVNERIGVALARLGRITEACEIAKQHDGGDRAAILIAIAQAGHPEALDEALEIAEKFVQTLDRDIPVRSVPLRREPDLPAIAAELADAGRINDAFSLIARLPLFDRAQALLSMVEADHPEALDEAREIVHLLARERSSKELFGMELAGRFGAALATAGRISDAQEVAQQLWSPDQAVVLAALVDAGCPGTIEAAREHVARRAPGLEHILMAMARAGDTYALDQARDNALSNAKTRRHAHRKGDRGIAEVAEALATAERLPEALDLIDSVTGEDADYTQAQILIRVARAGHPDLLDEARDIATRRSQHCWWRDSVLESIATVLAERPEFSTATRQAQLEQVITFEVAGLTGDRYHAR